MAAVLGSGPVLPTVSDLLTAKRTSHLFPAVISLAGDWRGYSPLENHRRRLFLPFEDSTFGDDPGSFTAAAAEEILGFVAADSSGLLVHCRHGQSRSTAVALGVAAFRGFEPAAAATGLLDAHTPGRPFVPNRLVVEVFDAVLGLGGALVAAGLGAYRP